jgi:hypothetical protein
MTKRPYERYSRSPRTTTEIEHREISQLREFKMRCYQILLNLSGFAFCLAIAWVSGMVLECNAVMHTLEYSDGAMRHNR